MKYKLRYQQRDFELSVGQFVIGRASDCQLSLDDPLTSRRHAQLIVSEDEVWLEDLASRNGVLVNGRLIKERQPLEHGDQVQIGNQRLTLFSAARDVVETQMRMTAPSVRDAASVLGNLADKALALGRGVEAERILAGYLEGLLSDLNAGLSWDDGLLDSAAEYASRLAQATGKGRWADYIFKVYFLRNRLCPAKVVDELYAALRKIDQLDQQQLKAYLERMRERVDAMTPNERFLLSRLEGLQRVAALK